jgi:uncharacterized protein YjiS (DUF1127 family)
MAELQQCDWHPFPCAAKYCASQQKLHGSIGMSVLNLLNSVREAFVDWRRRERAYAELMALDDHSLADIGIRRSDIRAICEGSHAPAQSEEPARLSRPGKFASPKPV